MKILFANLDAKLYKNVGHISPRRNEHGDRVANLDVYFIFKAMPRL